MIPVVRKVVGGSSSRGGDDLKPEDLEKKYQNDSAIGLFLLNLPL